MQQPLLYVILAAVAAVALAVGGALLVRYGWKRFVRRRVVRLIGRREAVRAGERTLRAVVVRLAEAPDDEIAAFAADPGDEDRRSLSDVVARMEVQADDLVRMPLPKGLWSAGELLADAAWRLGTEAGRVAGAGGAEEVLERLAGIDLIAVRDAVAAAEAEIVRLEEDHGVEEEAVYGGGLYI
ncbi:MAG: hypothetical protein IBX62_06495 [Coriobacteriia bacterium]|nr:hypothetical protein [Coriobacteriia bacterium]